MLSTVRTSCLWIFLVLATAVATAWAGTLSFDEALQRTLDCSPELQLSAAEAQERRGDWRQSQLYPNPAFGMNVNDIAGDRIVNFQNTAYELTQTIEWMPKRTAKQKAAKYDYYAACNWHERARIAVMNRLIKAFVVAAAAQETLELAEVRKQIAHSVLNTVADVSEAGKGSGIQHNKAEVECALADVDLQKAELDCFAAKEALALSWGASCPDFDRVSYSFYDVSSPEPLEACVAALEGHPEYRSAFCRYMAARSQVCYEEASRVPDVSLTVGYQMARSPEDRQATMGLTIPIPVWDQNQGNIYRAKSERLRACERCHLRLTLLRNKLALAHQEVMKAFREVQLLKNTALAISERSFELAKEGYQRGKFPYLDMLDSQRTLFEVRDKYIQAVLNYHLSKADLDYLVTQADE